MKIGILTQSLQGNYGGLLQNYALQQVLIKMGHKPITLDQEGWTLKGWRRLGLNVKMLIYNCLFGKRKYTYSQYIQNREILLLNMRAFVSQYIISTEKIFSKHAFHDKCISEGLDAIIVGSDQTWRPMYNFDIRWSYLNFATDLNIKRIAYAASFGTEEWEYTRQQTNQCKELVKRFDAVSVREESGVKLCKEHFNVEAEHVLDPTLLLEKDDYEKLIEEDYTKTAQDVGFAYILDMNNEKRQIIDRIAHTKGMDIHIINPIELSFNITENIANHVLPSPSQWLGNFRDAKFVVCDSFHGMVFSIIFNKDFVVLANQKRGMERFRSLLSILNLTDRVLSVQSDRIPYFNIDWVTVNQKVAFLRALSLNYLKRNLY